jgi:hypothetical protein
MNKKSPVIVLIAVLLVCLVVIGRRALLNTPQSALATVPQSFPPDSRGGLEEAWPDGSPKKLREQGRITVVGFYATRTSDACAKFRRHMSSFSRIRPDVAIRVIDLGPQWRNINTESRFGLSIRSLPHVIIYAADGQVVAEDRGRSKTGLKTLYDWVNQEMQ